MTDPLTNLLYNKPLIDFSQLVVDLRIDDQDQLADMVQYLINRCQRLEDRNRFLSNTTRGSQLIDLEERLKAEMELTTELRKQLEDMQ